VARATPFQTSFSFGELGELVGARIDQEYYARGVSMAENWAILTEGPATFRPGSCYSNEVKSSAAKTRCIPFVVNATTAYVIELGNQYMRFYRNHARLGAPYEIVAPWLTAELFGIQFRQISPTVMYLVHPSYAPRSLTWTSDTSWAIATPTFTGTWTFATASNYPAIIEVAENRLILGATDTNPLTVYGSQVGSFTNFNAGTGLAAEAWSYQLAGKEGDRLLWAVAGDKGIVVGTRRAEGLLTGDGSSVITPSSVHFRWHTSHGAAPAVPGAMVGDHLIFVQRGGRKVRDYLWTDASARYIAPDLTRLSRNISLSGISWMAYQGAPLSTLWMGRADGQVAALVFEEESSTLAWWRLVTDGVVECGCVIPTDGEDDELWLIVNRTIGGATKRYMEYLAPLELDDTPEVTTVTQHQVDCGISLDGKTATITNVVCTTPVTITGATQANPCVITALAHGFLNGDTVRIADVVGMEQLNGREFTVANKTADTFELSGENSTAYSAYVSGGKAVKTPDVTVTLSVTLASLSWVNGDLVRLEDIVGTDELNGLVGTIEGASGSNLSIDTGEVVARAAYVSGGTAAKVYASVSGLSHLEGETVAVLADGAAHGAKVVTAGVIDLDVYANVVKVGLPYTGILRSMRLEAGGMLGPAQTKTKRVSKARFRLFRSLGGLIGRDEDHLAPIIYRKPMDEVGWAPPLLTGDTQDVDFPGEYGSDAYIMVVAESPLPMTVVGIAADVTTYEG
jgi:hypothetical protein